jgi:hypothetical protein
VARGRAHEREGPIAEYWHFITVEHLRFLDGGHDLWAVSGDEAYARWWADLEFREEGFWVSGEGVFKLKFGERVGDRVLCSELREWVPYEPEHARHFEPYPNGPN